MSEHLDPDEKDRAGERRRGSPSDPVSREIGRLLDWLAPPAGAAIGLAGFPARHHEAITARGFLVRELDPSRWREAPPGRTPGPATAESIEGIALLDQGVWPYWEVEEIHRLRIRRLAELLPSGRRLVFGEREMLGRADLELARLIEQATRASADGPASRPNLRRSRFTFYSPVQARTLLAQCGFELEWVRNGLHSDESFDHDRPGMIFICRRA